MKKTLSPIPDEGNGASGSAEGSVSVKKLKENLSNLGELQQEHKERLGRVEEEIAKLQTFKKDYEHLLKRLQTLPDKTAHEVMVPFGSLAFMPGRLVHTNEILVLLGDNWFAERSAIQAADIVRRRLKDCDEKIKSAENTKKIHASWLKMVEEVLEGEAGDRVDIIEEVNEEVSQKSQEERKKRVSRVYAKLKEEERRELSTSDCVVEAVAGTSIMPEDGSSSESHDKFVENLSETDKQTYESIMKRLDQLELEDEAAGNKDDDDDEDKSGSEDTEDYEQDEDRERAVKFDIRASDDELRTMSDEGETSDAMLPAKRAKFKRRVSWADDVRTLYTVIPDDDSEDICRIKYTSLPLTLPLDEPLTESVGKTEGPAETIQSPSDIYKVFAHGASAPEPPPRGILKKSSSLPIQGDASDMQDGWCCPPKPLDIDLESPEDLPPPPPSPPPKRMQSLNAEGVDSQQKMALAHGGDKLSLRVGGGSSWRARIFRLRAGHLATWAGRVVGSRPWRLARWWAFSYRVLERKFGDAEASRAETSSKTQDQPKKVSKFKASKLKK